MTELSLSFLEEMPSPVRAVTEAVLARAISLKLDWGELRIPYTEMPAPPETVRLWGVRVDYHSVLVGWLGAAGLDGWRERPWLPLIRQAWHTKSWMPMPHDLVLVLVGPQDSADNEDWMAIQRRIERDEKICRKYVWLAPNDPGQWTPSLDEFLRRTFLARPWRDDDSKISPALDLLSGNISDDLPSAGAWMRLLTQENDPDLADRLILSMEVK